MNDEKKGNVFVRIFRGLWQATNVIRRAIINLVFIIFLLVIVIGLFSGEEKPEITEGALVMNLEGRIVEQTKVIDPFEQFINEASGSAQNDPEIALADVLYVIENAKHDKRVKALVLNLTKMRSTGLNKLQDIGQALTSFKASEKPIIAVGDWYTQDQYYLASYADEILMDPYGSVLIDGYGSYRMYYKSLLEKLKINTHVFRVGTYKSAVEPFLRDDMSDAAREANKAWLSDLWNAWLEDVATQRELDVAEMTATIHSLDSELKAVGGDMAKLTVKKGLVDQLATRNEMRNKLIELVGRDDEADTFKQFNFQTYLKLAKIGDNFKPNVKDKIGIVVAKGTIENGSKPAGSIGGDSTAKLLREARLDDDIKAVVLRVDSPGGSAFASEIIRQEVEELKKAGKPVVVSMSTYAASGGYWISAMADEIWASPTTITGSIGIFGLFATVENSLEYIGVHTDGVGTTPLSGMSQTRALAPELANIIQQSIEHGYQRFLELVAQGRDMTVEEVDKIAQGRVWSGLQAKKLGLVDELGSLEDAIASAAKLAGVNTYDSQLIEKPLSPKERFIKEMMDNVSVLLPQPAVSEKPLWVQLAKQLEQGVTLDQRLKDPAHVYALCMACEI